MPARKEATLEAETKRPIIVTPSWARFIKWVAETCPHGDVSVQIVGGSPTKLLSYRENVRFDKPTTLTRSDVTFNKDGP